jgi:ATP-dependent helicase/nuclease subunit A
VSTAAAPMPLDAPARETIVGDLDRNLFVEAGAGTGKTTSLVARIVRLVATGRLAEIRGLAAITFTEAAAAELRERIRTELERAADPAGGVADPAERLRCRAAAARVDEAVITTLHGFAQRILAEHPVAAGLPPAFEVDEGIPAELEFVARWGAFVDEVLADPALTDDLRVAVTLRLSLDRLGEVARLLHDRWDRLHDSGAAAGRGAAALDTDPSAVVAALRAAITLYEPYADADDGLVRRITDEVLPVAEAYDAAVATGDPLEVLRVLDAVGIPRLGNAGTKDVWGDDKPAVLALLREAGEARDALLAELRTHALGRLLPEVVRFTVDWAAERRRTGRLHFHDLLVLARDLLWSDAEVRAALGRRWSVLVIDEFQDTDPLQVELVFALAAADPSRLPDRWDDLRLAPGRLLVVGDPKQSIYGFRGADISLWTRAKQLFDGGVVHLQQNFRSVDSILGWVNALFDELIGEGDGEAQPAYTELLPSRTSLEAGSDVVILGGPAPDGLRAAEVRALEATEIAAAIRTLRATGHRVGEGDGDRPIRFDDVAILVPTRAPIGPIERALDDADVPYRIESRSLVWRTDVVREVLALLTAVEDPADEVAVVAALRSPAFACSDRDLVEWRVAGGRWDHTRLAPESIADDHPVRVAMRTLAGWHDGRHHRTVDVLLDEVVRERRLVELTMAQRRPRDHWRRIRFLVDQARAFVEAGGATLAQFLSWAALQTDEGATAVETVVPEPDDDAVRILTVHGAKGLEFPVVVLAGLSTGRPVPFTSVVWTDDGPELMLLAQGGQGAFATAGFDVAKAGAKRFEEAEAVRLLYVAATRARDQLLVSVHHPQRGANGTHAQLLHERGAAHAGTWRPAVLDDPPALFELPPEGPAPRTAEARAAWVARWERAMAEAATPWSVSPTGLAAELVDDSAAADPVPVLDDDDPSGTPPPRRRQGPVVGSAVHAVLERVPLAGTDPVPPEVVAEQALRAATEGGIAADAGTVAELASSALGSDALAAARASGRFWREVPVVVPMGSKVLEGFVDLVYERPDGSVVVVDWKTDRGHTPEAVDAALHRYRVQGAGYAAAIAAATGREVAEVRFVFCRAGGPPVERTIADLAGSVSEVSRLLG